MYAANFPRAERFVTTPLTPLSRDMAFKRQFGRTLEMITRRTALGLLAATPLAAGPVSKAFAADYPSRPVKFVVGYPPGGATDILARLIGQRLSERLGQQFVIENKPGAGNNIGTESVVNAEPDGY